MKYIYGITTNDCDNLEKIAGINERTLLTVNYNDICAVVSEVKDASEISVDDAVPHDRVLRTLSESHTTLPVNFGLIAPNDGEIVRLLRRGYTLFQNSLEEINGMIQIDVALFWHRSIYSYLLKNSSKLKEASKLVREKPEDQNLKIELGRLTLEALKEKEEAILPVILGELKALSLKTSEKPLKNELNILNMSFLVRHINQNKFSESIEKRRQEFNEFLDIKIVMPLPPYAFVKVRIEKPDITKIDHALNILGIDDNVNKFSIEKIYLKKVLLFHPDRINGDEKRFYEIQEAYSLLKEYFDSYDYNENIRNIKNDIIIKNSAN